MGASWNAAACSGGARRQRHPAPPRGWYLPALAAQRAELDSFDCVEGLVLAGRGEIEVLNAISLHGALADSWPGSGVTTDQVLAAMSARWRRHGLPTYAQFDNDTRFQGAHQYADTLGRVICFCLQLGVIAVFAPPRETGFQAAIEHYNGRWQTQVWQRWRHADLRALEARSRAYVLAHRQRTAARAEAAPARRGWPRHWRFAPRRPPTGLVIFLRRTNDQSQLTVLGHRWQLPSPWPHRLVRAEVHLSKNQIRFYALRRRQPDMHPLLHRASYHFPDSTQKRRLVNADT